MKKKTDLLLLLPSLAGFLTFFIIPFVYSFYYAFTENAFTKKFVWFDNFKRLFENEYFKLAMKNTGKFTVLAVPLTMVISLILALALVRFATRLPFVRQVRPVPAGDPAVRDHCDTVERVYLDLHAVSFPVAHLSLEIRRAERHADAHGSVRHG